MDARYCTQNCQTITEKHRITPVLFHEMNGMSLVENNNPMEDK